MNKRVSIFFLFLFLCFSSIGIGSAKESDVQGSKEHPLFNRMPGFYISRFEPKNFEAYPFRIGDGKEIQVEGKYSFVMYSIQPEFEEPSRIEILRNYENAITKIGGTVLYQDEEGNSYSKLVKDGKEFWIHVNAYITSQYTVAIIEKQGMAQTIVADAKAFSNDIETTGHAAVYGIYFDTGKSVIKPESEPALIEIAKLLNTKPDLKLNVVGHTDNVGTMDANMKLSLARAEAVVQALITKHKIAAARLKGFGVASLAPVSGNDSEAGRAKNRRVELVKQ